MPKTFNNLYPLIYDYENLYLAFREASKKKSLRPEVRKYEWNLEENLITTQNELIWKMWKPGAVRHIVVYEPKRREIAAPEFRDRVIHHALHRVISPLFERRYLDCSFACREGKGTHAAVDLVQRYIRYAAAHYEHPCIRKGDMSKYFYSVLHWRLKEQYRRTISCDGTLWLMDTILDNGSPNNDGTGFYPGALPSQDFANMMLDPFDHFMKEVLGIRFYVRYMDDWAAVLPMKAEAIEVGKAAKEYAEAELGLRENPKSCVMPALRLDFCGYITTPSYRKPRKRNVRRIRRRIRRMAVLCKQGRLNPDRLVSVWASFRGYMKHCDGHKATLEIWKDTNRALRGGRYGE